MSGSQGYTRRKPGMGVYTITNQITGRVYVGCTGNFSVRWTKHRVDLRARKHHNAPMQREWDEHGESAFVFTVLEAIGDVARMVAREQEEIDRFLRDTPHLLYNQRAFAHRNKTGAKRTHCTNGHALSDENVYISKDGHRHCRECDRAKHARRAKLPERIEQNRRYQRAARAAGKPQAYRTRNPQRWRDYQRNWRRKQRGIPLDRPLYAHPRGDASHATKIPDALIPTIKARVANGERQNAIARELGVSDALINKIVKGTIRNR